MLLDELLNQVTLSFMNHRGLRVGFSYLRIPFFELSGCLGSGFLKDLHESHRFGFLIGIGVLPIEPSLISRSLGKFFTN